MTVKTNITYIYDPLCGWCYGASPVVEKLVALPGYSVELAPSGFFTGEGARSMNADFAAFAWANDQRILSSTGQPFSEKYRRNVLNGRTQTFDSGPATLALTAVAMTAPVRELEALGKIQKHRYVAGGDITDLQALSHVLRELDMHDAADRLAAPDDELVAASQQRIETTRELMDQFRASGVPVLIAGSGEKRRIVRTSALFDSLEGLVADIGPSAHEPAQRQAT